MKKYGIGNNTISENMDNEVNYYYILVLDTSMRRMFINPWYFLLILAAEKVVIK